MPSRNRRESTATVDDDKLFLRTRHITRLLEFIKVSRPGFWPTHVWFYLLPFSQRYMFDSLPFWLGAFYVCFPLGLLLYGWNDIGDSETDSNNPRKGNWIFGARPDGETRRLLPWVIAIVQVPFLIVFVWIAGWKMLGWILAAVLVNALYNQFGFKRIPFLDLVNQAGYLLIFVFASWVCSIEQLNLPAMVFSTFFAMQSHMFGQVMDIEEDREAGRRTTAVLIGVFWSKLIVAALMAVQASIALMYFSSWLVVGFMVAGSIFFVADTFFGPRKYPLGFLKLFFVGWNVVAVATMYFIWRYGTFMLNPA